MSARWLVALALVVLGCSGAPTTPELVRITSPAVDAPTASEAGAPILDAAPATDANSADSWPLPPVELFPAWICSGLTEFVSADAGSFGRCVCVPPAYADPLEPPTPCSTETPLCCVATSGSCSCFTGEAASVACSQPLFSAERNVPSCPPPNTISRALP